MTWTLHTYVDEAEAKELAQYDLPPVTREFMLDDEGVRIEPWGRDPQGFRNLFSFSHGGMKLDFEARRVGEDWVDYDPANKSFANYALGPVCRVSLDTRDLPGGGSPEQISTIEKKITEFLAQAYPRCELAVAPYPEHVHFI
jgi:hypothetical protein